MSNNVYANGNAIACKQGDSKVIAAMPDVCLSPPSPPAGPVPVPYPNTSFSKDLQEGSKTVQINGGEAMLKDQSFYKTSPLGDEAATNGLGAGVVTHVITGKTYCVAWSMDVQFEGANVDRHTDMTTSNHASTPPNRGAPAPTTEDASKDCPHANLKRDPEKGQPSNDYPDPPGSQQQRLANKKRRKAERLFGLALKAEAAGNPARANSILNKAAGLDDNANGHEHEANVARDTNAKEVSIKVTCKDCGKLLQEFDVVTEDGVVKECKQRGQAVDEGQYLREKALAQNPAVFGPGTVVHIALPKGERQNVARLRNKEELAGQFQEH
jgi:hypothetical protein